MDTEQYYQHVLQELPATHVILQGWKQVKGGDNEWGPEDDLLWEDTWEGTKDTFREAAATTYDLHALPAFHSWKHPHTVTLQPLDHNPQRWTLEDNATTTVTIQQDLKSPTTYHLTSSDPAPYPPTSPGLHNIFAPISAELQAAKAPQQPHDEMPQAPTPPTARERLHQEPLAQPITRMELPPQHRTTPDRNGSRDLPREWEVQNSKLRWDEITLGLQAIRLHWITEPTDTWTLPADRHHPLLTVQGDATITQTEEGPHNSNPCLHSPHAPTVVVSAHDGTPGPDPVASHRHHLPRPERTHTHTHSWQDRWEDIPGDLLQEHLGLTRTHHTLHPVRGIAQAPHGIHDPGIWAYATPISPQAAEDIKATLSIQQPQTRTPHRNAQRGYTIWLAYEDHDTLNPKPGVPPLDPNTTALLQAGAAAAAQVGASETRSPQYLVEAKVAPQAKSQDKPPAPKPLHPPLKLDTAEETPNDDEAAHYIIPQATNCTKDAANVTFTRHLPLTTQVYELMAPNVPSTHQRHDEWYTKQAKGKPATTLYA